MLETQPRSAKYDNIVTLTVEQSAQGCLTVTSDQEDDAMLLVLPQGSTISATEVTVEGETRDHPGRVSVSGGPASRDELTIPPGECTATSELFVVHSIADE